MTETTAAPKAAPPAKAKKPADRKPKKGEPRAIKVGDLELTIDPDLLDDFELMDDIARLEEGEPQRAPSVLRRILGDDQFRQAMATLRDDKGKVRMSAAMEFFQSVFKAFSPNS